MCKVTCAICQKEFKKSPSFVSHLKIKHSYTKERYLQEFPLLFEDFNYNIVRSEDFKKRVSATKKQNREKYDFSYLRETNKKRSQKYVEKLNAMSADDKKKYLEKFQKSGSNATKTMWLNATDSFKEEHFKKIYGSRYRTLTEYTCSYCGVSFFRKFNSVDERPSRVYCSRACRNNYRKKNHSLFVTNTKTITTFFNKEVKLRSTFEVQFIKILEQYIIQNKITDYDLKIEPIGIEYKDNNGIAHTYIPDFLLTIKNVTYLIEIGSSYIKEILNPEIWSKKKEAAVIFCKENNFNFLFINDKNLELGKVYNEKNINKFVILLKGLLTNE
jgi:hypothetical protein